MDVGDWMRSSKLKLNPDKTEVLLFGTKLHRKEFMKHFPAKLLDQEITPTDSARNLGVVFDGGLNFREHISLICRSCYYHIRDLRRLRRKSLKPLQQRLFQVNWTIAMVSSIMLQTEN